jgi:uncharacterized Zn finger protein
MLTDYEVRQTCRDFGLSTDSEQCRRVARGYDLFNRGCVHKAEHQLRGYETWLVDSQYDRGTYTVRVFRYPNATTATCECPDYRKGFAETGMTGIHAGPECKHIIATLMQRDLERLQEEYQHAAD